MDCAAFHDELHPLDDPDVGERIARDGNDVGQQARAHAPPQADRGELLIELGYAQDDGG